MNHHHLESLMVQTALMEAIALKVLLCLSSVLRVHITHIEERRILGTVCLVMQESTARQLD